MCPFRHPNPQPIINPVKDSLTSSFDTGFSHQLQSMDTQLYRAFSDPNLGVQFCLFVRWLNQVTRTSCKVEWMSDFVLTATKRNTCQWAAQRRYTTRSLGDTVHAPHRRTASSNWVTSRLHWSTAHFVVRVALVSCYTVSLELQQRRSVVLGAMVNRTFRYIEQSSYHIQSLWGTPLYRTPDSGAREQNTWRVEGVCGHEWVTKASGGKKNTRAFASLEKLQVWFRCCYI